MPYKKKYYKKNKRYNRRRNWRKKYNTIVNLSRSPIARRALLKLRYCDQQTLNPGLAGVPASYSYRANSIYSPNASGGHQPLGHDQYQLFYNHYTVVGSKITVRFSNTDSGNSGVVAIRLDDDNSTIATPTTITEQGDTTYKYIGGVNAVSGTTLVKKFSMKKFFGLKKYTNRTGMGAQFGYNPTDRAWFIIYAFPQDPVRDQGEVTCYVTIEYIVMLTEPKDIAQS